MTTAAGKCFLDMLGVFAEFETNLRKERQMEGIAKAKAAGVYKGRPPSVDSAKVQQLKAEGWGPSQIARKLGIARASVYRALADADSGGFRSASLLRPAISTGTTPSQSRHRNLRPPAFTSVHCMGLLHLRQRGGGRFLTTMTLTLNWAGAQNSLSPIEAEDGAVMKAA